MKQYSIKLTAGKEELEYVVFLTDKEVQAVKDLIFQMSEIEKNWVYGKTEIKIIKQGEE